MRVSIVIPAYNMVNGKYFLQRNIESILRQTFRDFEIVVTDDSENSEIESWIDEIFTKYIDYAPSQMNIKYYQNGGEHGMANNTNFAIDKAQGQLIKILYQDDYFYDERSLWDIVRHFTNFTQWMVTSCVHTYDGEELFNEHKPYYSESENTIGSPSVLTIRREIKERFDPQFSWVLDLDLYKRLFRKYGKPKLLNEINVVIGVGEHQATNKLSEEVKSNEPQLLKQKYANSSITAGL